MNHQIDFNIVNFNIFDIQLGIQSGGCGEKSIRFRPALTFEEKHADIFLDKFNQVLKETK